MDALPLRGYGPSERLALVDELMTDAEQRLRAAKNAGEFRYLAGALSTLAAWRAREERTAGAALTKASRMDRAEGPLTTGDGAVEMAQPSDPIPRGMILAQRLRRLQE